MRKQKRKSLVILIIAIAFTVSLVSLFGVDNLVLAQQQPLLAQQQPLLAQQQLSCPPGQELAVDKNEPPDPRSNSCVLTNPAKGQLVNLSDFGELLQRFINIFLTFAGIIAVIFLIIGGFQYISSRGNEEAMEKAKKTIIGAVVGIIVIVLSFALVAIVNQLLTRGP